MRYLIIILGVVLAIPVIAYIIGLFISESHSASVTRYLNVPAEEVWVAVTGVEQYPEWRSDVERIEVLSDSAEALRWREFYSNNDPLTFEEDARIDSTRFAARIADEGLPFGGTWTYELQGTDTGVQLTITEDGEVYNPFFRFVSKFVLGYTATMNQYMDDLESHLGEGEGS